MQPRSVRFLSFRSAARRSLSSGNADFVDGWKLVAICPDEAANQFGAGKMPEAEKITKVIATHAHEEHVGNLNWLSEVTGAPICVSVLTARFLTPFKKLPWVRATIIGQPPNLKQPYHLLDETIDTESGYLQVIGTPGHCDDHVVLYDPKEKVLLAGDAFMGSYFATPNPDVDSRKWLLSLERLMELDIEILVEGHGHVHTLRADVPRFPRRGDPAGPESCDSAEVGLFALVARTD